ELLDRARPVAAAWQAQAAEADRAGHPAPEAVKALRASGLTGLSVPRGAGGLGASLAETAVVMECLGRADASLALILGMTLQVAGSVAEEGTLPPAVVSRLLAIAARGGLVNSAASEPEMGSPSHGGAYATRAERAPGGWRLTGRKTWVTGAPLLDAALVPASAGADAWTFLVELPAEGARVDTGAAGPGLALRASASLDLVLDGVFVPEALAAPPRPPSRPGGPPWFMTVVAAVYLGVGWAALDALRDYAWERVPSAYGRPIATLPKVRQAAGRMALRLSAARALLRQATVNGADRALLGAAKVAAVEAAVSSTDLAVQAAGAAALSARLPLERLFRDARAGLFNPPGEEAALERLAAAVLDEPVEETGPPGS
ncbi:MAG TPA: acyl-CoA dehydrogenase family protein, partial [Deinococcales bacterium]|nr:acyl-CoA dehydrogenase family protein [Deinococcales bacterium]